MRPENLFQIACEPSPRSPLVIEGPGEQGPAEHRLDDPRESSDVCVGLQ
jgi:hypothetical protein